MPIRIIPFYVAAFISPSGLPHRAKFCFERPQFAICHFVEKLPGVTMDERVQDLPVVRDAEAPASRTLSVGVGCEHKQYIAAKGAYLAVRRFVPLLYRVRSFHCRMILRRRIESADQVDDLIVGHFLSAIHSVAGVDVLFMGLRPCLF